MATPPTPQHPPTASPAVVPPVGALPAATEITIISHSSLFYWWPVWAVGFLMAILTYVDRHRMAVVPASSEEIRNASGVLVEPQGPGKETTITVKARDVLVLPDGEKLGDRPLKLHMTQRKDYGVLFLTVLLVVIVITNVPLRGGWSFAIIIFAILLSIILALSHAWETILEHLHYLDVRINMGGYVFFSSVLLIIWALTVFVFDRRIYMTFTPGQFKVSTELGGGESVYPAVGLSLQKQRSDLFRHWLLGLGSGDLIVKTSGAQSHQFELDNVLFINKKVREIERMMKSVVVSH